MHGFWDERQRAHAPAGEFFNGAVHPAAESPARVELAQAIEFIEKGEPELLIVSFGADTHEPDPISHLPLETSDYAAMGGRIASLGLPTVIVMEGGYRIEALGTNVARFLSGF